ncbi:MAG: type IV secretion system DNA-binding domain-containing protein [Candidatus Aminicenantales bacterium]
MIQLFEDPNESAPPEEKAEQKPVEEESINQIENKSDKESEKTLNLGWYYSENKDEFQLAKIAEKDRATHLYVVGATGTGKTKFLEYLIKQDIEKGNGFGVIDPHGDLIEDVKGFLILQYSPDDSEITDKVILIDPTDPNYTVTFNPLERIPGISEAELAGELVGALKTIWKDSWGARMEEMLINSFIALSENNMTLAELPLLLTDYYFRESVVLNIRNPVTRQYFKVFNSWTPKMRAFWAESTLNKINAFLVDDRIRYILSHPKSSFNMREAIDNQKIVLIKLDKGKLKDSADLLGSLFMAKIQMAAFSRSDLPQKKRTPFYMYIDEFQSFASESFSVILSEARKYGLSLIMAHQTLAQIPEELRSLILGNTGIQVYFRLNRYDSQTLAKEAFEYSGQEVKTVRKLSPVFWSLSEEWEQHFKELQTLEPRICYVKHKIEGGVIPINTVYIETAQEVFTEILGQTEEQFEKWFKSIPFGRKYVVEREKLAAESMARETQISERAKPYRKEYKKEIQKKETEIAKVAVPPKEKVPEIPEEKKQPKVEPALLKDKSVSQHRYLQNLIKKIAEDKGYKATIELPVLDGSGKVDVSLERDGRKIACEISITSTEDQELKNIKKCLAAGYEKVIVCSPDKKTLESIKALASKNIAESEQKKIYFFQPEELLMFLEEESAAELTKEERVKGYKVKVQYQAASEDEKKAKREAVANVILQAMKRMREKE